ncbi:MFS transporter [Blastococcus sp. URHD0036]|uniref:MFS transporter n=1 Tax=Blastococcus sp. URHD0036 TaxID=1380356 RepID=UPI0018CC5FBA|nr:MFS transporter [Blastococcus sp. URHD0036]
MEAYVAAQDTRSDEDLGTIETDVPARLDRLPFSRFHRMVIIGLGTVWILDGLEVTIVGSIAARMTEAGSGIDITASQIGLAASIYIVGACIGALFFGQLTDRFGRKRLFLLTLGVYITATVLTAFAWTPWFFYLCRFFTGAGIGGEYAAINSAVDELIPARLRGRVDLLINGSYWLGAAVGSGATLLLLDENLFSASVGWRLAFVMGAVLGAVILVVRRHVPESPRWLFIHGRADEADETVDRIEAEVREETGQDLEEVSQTLRIRQREVIPFREIAHVAFTRYPKRAVLGLALFVGQAFLYNGFTFNLGTLMSTYFGVASGFVPVFLVVYALGNFLGPLLLGRLFDTVGRKPMISFAYLGSAVMAVVTALLFTGLNSWTFILLLSVTFFLASSGASAAYLTVSEIFPMETRALAIAFFYAVGTGLGGIVGPLLFGRLIESGDPEALMTGFFIAAGVMALGGIAELAFGVKAENASLESIAEPLTAEDGDGSDGDGSDEDATRIRERSARREQRERAGARRYRPGPGQRMSSPRMTVTTPVRDDRSLDRQIASVEAVLRQRGTLTREALAEAVGARWWGPGQFRSALRAAVSEGRAVVVGRGRYGPGGPVA